MTREELINLIVDAHVRLGGDRGWIVRILHDLLGGVGRPIKPDVLNEMVSALRYAERRLRVNDDPDHPGPWDRCFYEVIAGALGRYEGRNKGEAR